VTRLPSWLISLAARTVAPCIRTAALTDTPHLWGFFFSQIYAKLSVLFYKREDAMFDWKQAEKVAKRLEQEPEHTESLTWMTKFIAGSTVMEWLICVMMMTTLSFGVANIGQTVGLNEHISLVLVFLIGLTCLYCWGSVAFSKFTLVFFDLKRWRWSSSFFPLAAYCLIFGIFMSLRESSG